MKTNSRPKRNENIFAHIAEAISRSSGGEIDSQKIILSAPPSRNFGDYAFECFEVAKKWKVRPDEAANKLATNLKATNLISKASASGPYLNIFLNRGAVSLGALKSILKESNRFGDSKIGVGEVVMMEYVSPNTNKPLHLGHVRNGLLGWSVAEIIKTQKSKVYKTDIVNDRGIHIMKSMLAYMRWGNGEAPKSAQTKSDHFVGQYYVRFEKEYQKEFAQWLSGKNINLSFLAEKEKAEMENQFAAQSALLLAAHELLKQWEKEDKKVINLWKKMNQWVYQGFKETYLKLGLDFDRHYFESKIYKGGKEFILDAVKNGIFRRAENGAVIAPLSEHPEIFPQNDKAGSKPISLDDKVLLRADGTGLYVTQDINLAVIKFKDFKLTQSIYCVGSEQDYYLRQLFAILKLLKFPWAKNLYHLSYGMVYLPEGKMKSREGRVVDADELILKIINLAEETLHERYPNIPEKEIKRRARVIGLGALKFHFLIVGRNTPIYFDPKASLSFEGKTGPYLQYSYARASSIIRKSKGKVNLPRKVSLVSDLEWQIILSLQNFPKILSDSASELDPSGLANYLINLSQEFNTFYHSLPVLEAEKEVRQTRLAITKAFQAVVKKGISLLGMEVLEEM